MQELFKKSKDESTRFGYGKAHTVVEILITFTIIGILMALATVALLKAKENGEKTAQKANIRILNNAVTSSKLGNLSGPGTQGNNKQDAIAFYKENAILPPSKNPNLERIEFLGEFWFQTPAQDIKEFRKTLPKKELNQENIWELIVNLQGYPSIQSMSQSLGWNTPEEMILHYEDQTESGSLDNPSAKVLNDWYDLFEIIDTQKIINDQTLFAQTLFKLDELNPSERKMIIYSDDKNHIKLEPRALNQLFQLALQYEGDPTKSAIKDEARKWQQDIINTALNPNLSNYSPNEIDLSQVNTTGFDLESIRFRSSNLSEEQISQTRSITNCDFSGLNPNELSLENTIVTFSDFSQLAYPDQISEKILNKLSTLQGNNLTGINLTGFDPAGKSLAQSNLSETTGLSTQDLFKASDITQINLTGWNFPNEISINNLQRLRGANLAYTSGITAVDLNNLPGGSYSLKGFKLQGWDLALLQTQGKVLDNTDLRNTNIQASKLNQATSFRGAKIDPENIIGFDPSGRSLENTDFGLNITTPEQFEAATGITPSPGTIWINGSQPWG